MKLQSEGTLSMSPVRLFQQRTGAYLLGLQVQYEYESGAQDQHCAAYLSDFAKSQAKRAIDGEGTARAAGSGLVAAGPSPTSLATM
jgi:hypothetical protein